MVKKGIEELGKISKINLRILIIFLFVLILVIGLVWFLVNVLTKEEIEQPPIQELGVVCGDGVCDSGENCMQDCIERDLNLCKDEYKNLCLAILNEDATYCDSLKSEDIKNSCLHKTTFIFDIIKTKDEKSCENMKGLEPEICLNIVGSVKNDDINLCESKDCEFAFSLYRAISKNDVNLCENIADKSTINYCKLYLTSNIDYCDYSYCYDVYNIHMREVTDDLSYCENVLSSSGKQACLEWGKV